MSFEQDIKSRDTSLFPIVDIGEDIKISTNSVTLNGQYYKPLLLNVPSLKESIDIEKRKYKISNVTLSISNYVGGDGVRFSEMVQDSSLINKEVNISWVSQSNEPYLIYKGQIRRYTHDDEKVRLIIEDKSQATLHKDLPLPQDYLTEYEANPKYVNKPKPIVYGYVDRSPCILTQETGSTTVISDDRLTELNILDLYIFSEQYYLVPNNMSEFNEHLNFPETKQWEYGETGRIEFNYRRMSPQNLTATKAKSPLAFNVVYVKTTAYPDGEYLLSNDMADSELIYEQGDYRYYSSYPAMEQGEQVEIMLEEPVPSQYDNIKYGYQYFLKNVSNKSSIQVLKRDANGIPLQDENGEDIVEFDFTLAKIRDVFGFNWEVIVGQSGYTDVPYTLVKMPREGQYGASNYINQYSWDGENTSGNPYVVNLDSSINYSGWVKSNDVTAATFEVRSGDGGDNHWGFVGSSILSSLMIDYKYRYINYFMEDAFEKDFYVDVKGRIMQDLEADPEINDTSPKLPNIVEDLMVRELGQSSFNLPEEYADWKYAFTISEKINSKKLLEELSASSPFIARFDNLGNFKFDLIKDRYGEIDLNNAKLVEEIDCIQWAYSRTKVEEICSKIQFWYKWDYGLKSFQKNTEIHIGELNQFDVGDGEEYFNFYGLENGFNNEHLESTLVVDNATGKYIRNEETAKKYARWLLYLHCNQHLKVKVKLPLKYLEIEIGNLIAFDKVLGDVKPYGIDYSQGATFKLTVDGDEIEYLGDFVNFSQAYPLFMCISTNKTLEHIELECIQLHKLADEE